MRLLLIRHGTTDWNQGGRYQGRTDVPLGPAGRAEAAALAAALRGEAVDALVSSPLSRAVDTAQPLAEAWDLPLTIEPGLIEMDLGDWEGLSHDDILDRDAAAWRAWWEDAGQVSPPGGETLAAVADRAMAVVDRLRAEHAGGCVALVAHVAPIKAILLRLLDLPLQRHRQIYLERASVTVLDLGEETVLMSLGRVYPPAAQVSTSS